MKLKITVILFLCTIFIGCSKNQDNPDHSVGMLTQQEIIEVAKKEGVELELSMELITVYYDVNNIEWESYLTELQKEDKKAYKWTKKRLKNRYYQAVHLRPEPGKVLDGSFWVLIDKKTGEVIMGIQD
jgi:hypothetical protein